MIETKFKDTEVGRIPEDWAINTIEEIASITTGSQNTQDHKENGEYPFYVRSQQVEYIDKWIFNTEGVVTAGDGVGTGKVFHYVNGKFGLHQRCYLIHQFNDSVDAKYFYWMFSSSFYERVHSMTAKSSVDSVRREMIADMSVPIPPKSEQKRIAKALSNIDALISELGKLIEKKQAIKQGAMQQLLTGKKRLKGFTEPWTVKKLGEISSIYDGTHQTPHYVDNGVPFYSVENVTANDFVNTKYISEEEHKALSARVIIEQGDVLMTRIGSIGKCKYVDWKPKASFYVSLALIKCIDSVDAKFISYYSNSKQFKKEIELRSLFMAIPQKINLGPIADIIINIPPSQEEQSAIASVLSSMDEEISALEAKRDKYTAIKQGMMQQLLTGKIRLVETAVKTNATSANVYFRRSVLAAEIADRLCDEPTFGHVKMEKILFLSERLCHIDIGSHYHRDAAGPYDNTALRSIDSQLKKQKWFDVKRTEKGNRYVPMQNRGKHKTYFNRYYSDVLPIFDKIINTFKTQRTEQCEIVATLYSAWEDLLHSNKDFTDADIVNEVLNNWHESKKRISQDRWLSAIQWMRENGVAPNV